MSIIVYERQKFYVPSVRGLNHDAPGAAGRNDEKTPACVDTQAGFVEAEPMSNYDEGSDNPTGRSCGVAPYHQYSGEGGKEQIQQHSESETGILIPEDDAVIMPDGGAPTLTGSSASETDLAADEKHAFRVRTKLTNESTAREVKRIMIEAGVKPDRIEIVEERVEVDSR